MTDAPDSKLTTANHAVTSDGFLGVLGAGGIKTALLTDQQAQGELVQGNQLDQQSFQHGQCSVRRSFQAFLTKVGSQTVQLVSELRVHESISILSDQHYQIQVSR